ncbi:hypothetical protein BGW80DRAFT_1318668 [Lactifluus volemus]|nr:hypothetical protein BGW80DRAFT_1318668 [Lactifluus volemus]
MCNMTNHHSHITEVVVDAADETAHHPSITSPTLSPPDHNDLHLTDESSLYDVPHLTSVIESLQPSSSFNVESNHFVATSLESATRSATQGPAPLATISPTVTSRSGPRPDFVASTSVAQVSFTLPSSSADSL